MQPSTFRSGPAPRGAHPPATLVAILAGLLALTAAAGLSAKDWPQWRGEERRGVWTETGILEAFPDTGLTVKWRAPVNGGSGGPGVAAGGGLVRD